MGLAPADHLGEGNTGFRRAHGPGHGEEPLPARVEKLAPARRNVDHGGGVEVPELALDEPGDGSGDDVERKRSRQLSK